ncbi:mechanosensitive ion channel family protein [Marinobacter nanhaiticus D15-8W]|uniref:Small-conductance mechanosensitive channel n=2 Tax=Marinobacter TaxID=2742 RepID=N6X5G3_9GAMM|nr:mechanosensitive ion channel family protein [Marinobacter nanhaiticus D15-8W]
MLVAKRLILGRLLRLTDRSRYQFDSLFISALPWPLTFLILLFSLILLKTLSVHYELALPYLATYSGIAEYILVIAAVVVFVDRLCAGAITQYSEHSEALRSSRTILKGVSRGIIWGLGLLVLLGTLGISITPIIASLGITSLAVALALQPTLENFFSGVQLVMDKPIRVGDFIELDSGEQGFVEKIGWRSTWIRMLPNNMVIMPNSALSQSKIINYYYPQKELSVPVEVGVHYDSDLDHVERVALEVAREVLRTHEWGVPEYNTFVLFHTFDNSSINFTVMLRAKEYFNRFWVKSAFMKLLHKRFAEEGITIPYPIRAINLDQEQVREAFESRNSEEKRQPPRGPESIRTDEAS